MHRLHLMMRVGPANWEWCVRMCISETGILVVSAPGMAAPLEAGRHLVPTIHLSSAEGGDSLSKPTPGCGCPDAGRFQGGESHSIPILVSGSLAIPALASTSGAGSVRTDGDLHVRLLSEPAEVADEMPLLVTRSVSAREPDRMHTASETEAMIVRDIQFILRMRRARAEFFDENLFADPAWDMMLDLMEARLRGTEILTSSLCMAASVPATTALRWIKNLTEKGILVRRADDADKRRVYVALSDAAASAMMDWFELVHRQKPAIGL